MGGEITLQYSQQTGNWTHNGQRVTSGYELLGENRQRYRLTESEGTWMAQFVPTRFEPLSLGEGGDSVSLQVWEDGSYRLDGEPLMAGQVVEATNGNTYRLERDSAGDWAASFVSGPTAPSGGAQPPLGGDVVALYGQYLDLLNDVFVDYGQPPLGDQITDQALEVFRAGVEAGYIDEDVYRPILQTTIDLLRSALRGGATIDPFALYTELAERLLGDTSGDSGTPITTPPPPSPPPSTSTGLRTVTLPSPRLPGPSPTPQHLFEDRTTWLSTDAPNLGLGRQLKQDEPGILGNVQISTLGADPFEDVFVSLDRLSETGRVRLTGIEPSPDAVGSTVVEAAFGWTDHGRFGVWGETVRLLSGYNRLEPPRPAHRAAFAFSPLEATKYVEADHDNIVRGVRGSYSGRTLAVAALSHGSVLLDGDIEISVGVTERSQGNLAITMVIENLSDMDTGELLQDSAGFDVRSISTSQEFAPDLVSVDSSTGTMGFSGSTFMRVEYADRGRSDRSTFTRAFSQQGRFVGADPGGPDGVIGTWSVTGIRPLLPIMSGAFSADREP